MAITIGTTGRFESGTTRRLTIAQLMSDPKRGLWARRQRIAQTQQRIVWELPFAFLRASEMNAILTEFNTAMGAAGEVTFRPPQATNDITVQFVDDFFSYTRISRTHYRVRFTLEQAVVI